MISQFAAALAAEPVLTLGPITLTNSMVLGMIGAVVITTVLVKAAKQVGRRPGGTLSHIVEVAVEFIVNITESVMHDRKRAVKFAPLILSLFLFILLSNWIGLLPGVGPITVGGVPLLRAFTADLNGTLALALFTILLIQFYAIKELGILGHLKHYFTDRPYNPINFFVGILEILGEFTKILSLSLRLFGNVFAGEVLLGVISQITSYGSPLATLPFYFMEIFVGFIQAFVFTMLTIVFLSLATHHEHREEVVEELTDSIAHPLDTVKGKRASGTA